MTMLDLSRKHDRATELRAIADGRLLLNVRNGVTVARSMLARIADEFEAIATALAAKNAELAAYRQSSVHPDDYEAVKAQLAEARKAHSTILAVLGNVEHRGGGPNAARMYADMLNDIREIARRALTGGKVDG